MSIQQLKLALVEMGEQIAKDTIELANLAIEAGDETLAKEVLNEINLHKEELELALQLEAETAVMAEPPVIEMPIMTPGRDARNRGSSKRKAFARAPRVVIVPAPRRNILKEALDSAGVFAGKYPQA